MAMHPSMKRLYQAAGELSRPITGQSELARALGESPQTVKNWESRGISQRGATSAQAKLGILATWIHSGTGPHRIISGVTPTDPELATAPQPASQSVSEVEQKMAKAANLVISQFEQWDVDFRPKEDFDLILGVYSVLARDTQNNVIHATKWLIREVEGRGILEARSK